MMRVLVTGHLGYIGTVMKPMLLKAGHQVIGFDSNLYEKCAFAAGGIQGRWWLASVGARSFHRAYYSFRR